MPEFEIEQDGLRIKVELTCPDTRPSIAIWQWNPSYSLTGDSDLISLSPDEFRGFCQKGLDFLTRNEL